MAAIHPNRASNCWLGADGFGVKRVRVPRLQHGMEITGNTDSAKGYKAFYPVRVSRGSTLVTFVFPSHSSYESFSKWMEAYARRLAATDDQVGPMRVIVPAFGFNITAVPTSGWSYGDKVGAVVYTSTVTFDSAGSASDFTNLELSRFRRPKRDWEDSRFFYPSGRQVGTSIVDRLSGSEPAPDIPQTGLEANPDVYSDLRTGE